MFIQPTSFQAMLLKKCVSNYCFDCSRFSSRVKSNKTIEDWRDKGHAYRDRRDRLEFSVSKEEARFNLIDAKRGSERESRAGVIVVVNGSGAWQAVVTALPFRISCAPLIDTFAQFLFAYFSSSRIRSMCLLIFDDGIVEVVFLTKNYSFAI